MTTEGYTALICYDGQPLTFCACHGTDHMVQNCQSRTRTQQSTIKNNTVARLQMDNAMEKTQFGPLLHSVKEKVYSSSYPSVF
jgi:hypothetical protein